MSIWQSVRDWAPINTVNLSQSQFHSPLANCHVHPAGPPRLGKAILHQAALHHGCHGSNTKAGSSAEPGIPSPISKLWGIDAAQTIAWIGPFTAKESFPTSQDKGRKD